MDTKNELKSQRLQLLRNFNRLVDKPLTYLSFIWLAIIILEFTVGVNPALEYVSYIIWAAFIIDFIIELVIAPDNKKFLKENWLLAISLLLPALRVFRVFQSVQALRAVSSLGSLNVLKIVTSLNRALTSLRSYATSYGLRYIGIFTSLVLFSGAAGMLFFENPQVLADRGIEAKGLDTYGEAIWWTTMLMTTIGSEYWPQTTEGRMLTIVLSLYAIAIFGYITATLASLLIGKKTT